MLSEVRILRTRLPSFFVVVVFCTGPMTWHLVLPKDSNTVEEEEILLSHRSAEAGDVVNGIEHYFLL